MILYHFTLADRAERILEHGLLPRDDARNIVGGGAGRLADRANRYPLH
jgi:hypothetical protein